MTDLTVRGQYEEARRAVADRRIAEALARCQRILATYPRHIGTYGVLGQIYLELGRHEEAASLFRRVLSADPENTIAYASLGAIYEARGLVDEAIWQLERALELSPRNVEVRAALRRLRLQRTPGIGGRVKMTRGALARVYLRARLLGKAIGELRELVSEQPYRLDLRVALAEALWHDHRLADAEAVSIGILDELPNCLKANLILGRIWLHTDEDDRARALLQCAQALDPENIVARSLFGDDSPLPVRIARLPLVEKETEPLDLPYLVDDEEVVAMGPIIEGAKPSVGSKPPLPHPGHGSERTPGIIDWRSLDQEALRMLGFVAEPERTRPALSPSAEEIQSSAWEDRPVREKDVEACDEAEETPVEEVTAATTIVEEGFRPVRGAVACPEGLSLLDVQRLRVEQNPEDHVERLRLARLQGSLGNIEEALEQYAYLVQERRALTDVGHDLGLLNLLRPGNAKLTTLLLAVRYGPPDPA